jgi:hypothetical protein
MFYRVNDQHGPGGFILELDCNGLAAVRTTPQTARPARQLSQEVPDHDRNRSDPV